MSQTTRDLYEQWPSNSSLVESLEAWWGFPDAGSRRRATELVARTLSASPHCVCVMFTSCRLRHIATLLQVMPRLSTTTRGRQAPYHLSHAERSVV